MTTTFFNKTTDERSVNPLKKFHKNSAFRLSFSRKSASGRDGEFRRSAEKLLKFRIGQRIVFKFRRCANLDDPHVLACAEIRNLSPPSSLQQILKLLAIHVIFYKKLLLKNTQPSDHQKLRNSICFDKGDP